jgi:glycosyltransferase involved in cell wall biosynthesis
MPLRSAGSPVSSPSVAGRTPLRVLMVTGAYFPEISSSGLQCQVVARLVRDVASCEVLTTATDASLPLRELVEGVRVRRVYVDVTRPVSKCRATLLMLARLFRSMPRVHVVHIHGFSTKNVLVAGVAKLFGRPVVLSLHTAGHDEPEAIRRQGPLARWAFDAADLYLSVSPALVEACLAAGLAPEKVRLVPNGIDLERFSPVTAAERVSLRQSLGLPGERPAILFVGFFSREKQPQVLLEAWLRLQRDQGPVATLVFVGATRSPYFEVDDSLAAEMRARAERDGVGDRVVFVAPTHRVEDYYRAADVFALPSSREGLPVALLEAMAAGLPCVASRLPGATDVLIANGENGILVPPGDINALAAALTSLLTDRPRAAALGAAARQRVARDYTSGQTAGRWIDAYRGVVTALQ